MSVLRSHIRTTSPEFLGQKAHHEALAAELAARIEAVSKGGPQKAVEVHRSRGKLLPRQRIERLLDPDTPFLELSPLAAYDLYGAEVPSAGIEPTRS